MTDDFDYDKLLESYHAEEWWGCYRKRWKGEMTDPAMAHPAKVSFGLAERIYDHAMREGWLHEGSRIVDPFFGVGGFGFHALINGMEIVGCEIEPRFITLAAGGECDGQPTVVKEEAPKRTFKGWYILTKISDDEDSPGSEVLGYVGANDVSGITILFDGFPSLEDAHLCLRNEGLKIDEMPIQYIETTIGGEKEIIKPCICGKRVKHEPHHIEGNLELWQRRYSGKLPKFGKARAILGDSRNLGKVLREAGVIGAVDNITSSPPFTGVSSDGGWQMLGNYAEKGKLTVAQVQGDPNKSYPSWNAQRDTSYGHAEGQMADMEPGEIDLAASSPPYSGARIDGNGDEGSSGLRAEDGSYLRGPEGWEARKAMGGRYGEDEGQLANMPGDDLDMAVGSPPFIAQGGGTNVTSTEGPLADGRLLARHAAGNSAAHAYGHDDGNLGNKEEGDIADAILSSPPFADTLSRDRVNAEERREYARSVGESNAEHISPIDMENLGKRDQQGGGEPGNLGNLQDDGLSMALSSPPYAEVSQSGGTAGLKEHGTGLTGGERFFDEYGETPGQVGRMKDEGITTAISSPPYAEGLGHGLGTHTEIDQEKKVDNIIYKYGNSEGQLSHMSGCISSPPFEAVTGDRPSQQLIDSVANGELNHFGPAVSSREGYGETEGNIGNDSGDTFWMASRKILEELYKVLKPGGHAIFVCKRYVKAGKAVPFSGQWLRLCMAVGFIPLHWHKAHQSESRGDQYDLMGNLIHKKVRRASFFRIMAEKKGSPVIEYEDVLCLMKPE